MLTGTIEFRLVGRSLRTLVLVAVAIATLSGERCDGADSVIKALFNFFRPQPMAEAEPAVEWVPLEGENEYTPHLKKLLGSELHFLRKVCGCDDAQLQVFRELGLLKVQELSGQYGKMQNRQSTEWPDARLVMTDAFIKKAQEILAEEVAQRYADEIQGRRSAQQDAALSMMITIADRKLALHSDQAARIREQLTGQWDSSWSRNMQVFLYDEYSPRPPDKVLNAVLNERQRNVMKATQNYGRISFGWEQDLGFLPFWGDDGTVLEEVK